MYTYALKTQPYLSQLIALSGAIIVISVFLYGFLLLGAVGYTASRSEAQANIREIVGDLGSLEASYLAHTKEITPERAQAMGLVAPSAVFVVFADDRPALTLNATVAR